MKTENPPLPGQLRRARPEERDALLACIHASFAEQESAPSDFAVHYPHLFTTQRIANHWVYEEDGTFLGVVGCYPMTFRVGGTAFAAAGIGQVSTRPEGRGRGIMSRLLETALSAEAAIDFFFLWGERFRYGRQGFAWGGLTTRFQTNSARLCAASGGTSPTRTVRALDFPRDAARIVEGFRELPQTLEFTDDELLANLQGKGCFGFVDEGGTAVLLAEPKYNAAYLLGRGEGAVPGLLRAWNDELCRRRGKDSINATIESGPEVGLGRFAGGLCYTSVSTVPSAMYRAGNLESLAPRLRAAFPAHDWGWLNAQDQPESTEQLRQISEAIFGWAGPCSETADTISWQPLPLHVAQPLYL